MTSMMAAEKCSTARMPTEAGKSTFSIAVVCQWSVNYTIDCEFDCVQFNTSALLRLPFTYV
jgi:hypothetical protein